MKHVALALASITLGVASLASVSGASVNVALDAKAFANGPIFNNAFPALLVNGDKSGTGNQVMHGIAGISPGFAYWIDLGSEHSIDQIKIYPRQDGCCAERLSNFHVSVHEDEFTDNLPTFEMWAGDFYTDGSNAGSSAGSVVTITSAMGSGTFAGRWVKITSLANPVPDYALQMTEIEVFAEGPELRNFAKDAAATSDRPLYVGLPIAMLTDGNRQSVFHGDTDPTPGFRYEIDMGIEVNIDHINLWARQDGCCAERLSNYRVTVHGPGVGGIGAEVWGATLHNDGSNPGSGSGAKDTLRASLDAGRTFAGRYIRIESQANPMPSYALQMTELEVWGTASPGVVVQITRQPQDVLTLPPRQATFQIGVNAINGDPALLRYQWQKDGVNIPNGTNTTYTTPPVAYADSSTTRYRCIVSYPGRADTTSTEAGIIFNHALGAAAYSNRPLYAGWSVSQLVDGDRLAAIHGDVGIEPGFAYEVDLGGTVNLSQLVIYPRQDGCCGQRLTQFRVSVHEDGNGSAGTELWHADLFTDGSNPGSASGGKILIGPGLDPLGTFSGRWIRITSLENPVQNYALQMTELEAFGSLAPGISLTISHPPQNVVSAPYRNGAFTVEPRLLNGDYGALQYQWQRNGVNIVGANATTYAPPPFRQGDEGATYRVVVTYPGGPQVTSADGVVTFDYNYARGSAAYANQLLWVPGGWSIGMLVDGNRSAVFHGNSGLAPGFAYQVDLGLTVEISNIVIYPRQDGCCPERLSNILLSIHEDDHGAPGVVRWSANLFTDGANAGSGAGIMFNVGPELDPFNPFSGRWVKIQALDDPVRDYSLQMTELEVYGRALALEFKTTGSQLELIWFAGILESAPAVNGPWSEVPGAVSPMTITPGPGVRFFRLRD